MALLNARRPPIYYSAFGPKALKLAGERGDGVIMFCSMNLVDTQRKINGLRDLGVGAFITNMPGHAYREGNMRALAAMLK